MPNNHEYSFEACTEDAQMYAVSKTFFNFLTGLHPAHLLIDALAVGLVQSEQDMQKFLPLISSYEAQIVAQPAVTVILPPQLQTPVNRAQERLQFYIDDILASFPKPGKTPDTFSITLQGSSPLGTTQKESPLFHLSPLGRLVKDSTDAIVPNPFTSRRAARIRPQLIPSIEFTFHNDHPMSLTFRYGLKKGTS